MTLNPFTSKEKMSKVNSESNVSSGSKVNSESKIDSKHIRKELRKMLDAYEEYADRFVKFVDDNYDEEV